MKNINKVNFEDKAVTVILYVISFMLLAFLAAFIIYILVKGFACAGTEMFSFTKNGILNQLFNTFYLVLIAMIISVPIGVFAGIYLAVYSKDSIFTKTIKICIETLSSLPSIVVGLFGYLAFILYTGMKWNLFAGAVTVTIICLPVIITTTINAISSLPETLKTGSLGLGATCWQTVFHILLPACFPGIITGIILASSRAFGEAAALLYTAGMSTDINWNNFNIFSSSCPINPFRPGETLTLHIWSMFTEATLPNAKDIANLSAAVLIVFIFIFNILMRVISGRIERKMGGNLK